MKPKFKSSEITRLTNGYSHILTQFNTGNLKEGAAQQQILQKIKASHIRNNYDGQTHLILLTPSQSAVTNFNDSVKNAFTSAEFNDASHIRALDLSRLVIDAATPNQILATVVKNLEQAEQEASRSIFDLPIDKLSAHHRKPAESLLGKTSRVLTKKVIDVVDGIRENFAEQGGYLAYIKLPTLEISNAKEFARLCQLMAKVDTTDLSNITIHPDLLNHKTLVKIFTQLHFSSSKAHRLFNVFKGVKGNGLNTSFKQPALAELAQEAYKLSVSYQEKLPYCELSADNLRVDRYEDLQHLAILATTTDHLQLKDIQADNSLLNIYNFINLLNEQTIPFQLLSRLFMDLDKNTNGSGEHKRKINFTDTTDELGFKMIARAIRSIKESYQDPINEKLSKIEAIIANNKDKALEEIMELEGALEEFDRMERRQAIELRNATNCLLLQCELGSIVKMKQQHRLNKPRQRLDTIQTSGIDRQTMIGQHSRQLLLQHYTDRIERSIVDYKDQVAALYHLEHALEAFANEPKTIHFILSAAIEDAFRHSKARLATAMLQFAIENSPDDQAFELRALAIKSVMSRTRSANSYPLIAAAVQGKEIGKLLSLAINEAINADKPKLAIRLLDLAMEKGIIIQLPEIVDAAFDLRGKIPAEYQCYQVPKKALSLKGFINYFSAKPPREELQLSRAKQGFSAFINYEFANIGVSITPLFLAKAGSIVVPLAAVAIVSLFFVPHAALALAAIGGIAAVGALGYAGYHWSKYKAYAQDVFRGKDKTKASYAIAYNGRRIEVKTAAQATAVPTVTQIPDAKSNMPYQDTMRLEGWALEAKIMADRYSHEAPGLTRLAANLGRLMHDKADESVKLQTAQQYIDDFRKSIGGVPGLMINFNKHFPLCVQSQALQQRLVAGKPKSTESLEPPSSTSLNRTR